MVAFRRLDYFPCKYVYCMNWTLIMFSVILIFYIYFISSLLDYN